MKVYVAGPISGRAEDDYLNHFARATKYLASVGHEPINPAVSFAFACTPDHAHKHCCYMRSGLVQLLKCEGIYMLEGWQNSRGAKFELDVAWACSMQIIYENADFY